MEQPEKSEGEPHSAFPIIDSVVTIIWDPGNKEFPCIFCKQPTVDELNLGPLYRLPEHEQGVVAHYFCMLFSAGLVQQGDDKQGILGFLPEDIFKEVRRAQRLKCTYCQVNGASIGCSTSRCKTSFHFPCGLANDANFQFFKNYQAFCRSHSTLPETNLPLAERKCPICLNEVKPPERPIIGQCCKTAIFHKRCLQRMALNAGYFFRCPTCNSHEDFPDNTKFQGIFVPEQDASWEREPNAYEDLYQSYNHCDAEKCECPKGRDYGANKGSWLLARCRTCGSAGTHRLCGKLSTIANWACVGCLEVEARTTNGKKSSKSIQIEPTPSTSAVAHIPVSGTKTVARKQLNINSKAVLATGTTNDAAASKTSAVKNKLAEPDNEDETELHVVSKRVKPTGVPGELDKEEDNKDVDLSQIQIQLSCRDYFPLSKEVKKKFVSEEGILPDWRNYRLRVQMVDVFLDAIDATKNPIRITPRRRKINKPITNGSAVQFLEKRISNDNIKTSSKIQIAPLSKNRKRNKRTSSWSKGWVKRKKKPTSSKQQPDHNHKSIPDSDSEISLGHKSAETTSSASQAILVGIQRSRESLLQLNAQSSGKNDLDGGFSNGKNGEESNVKDDSSRSNSERSRRTLDSALFSDNDNIGTGPVSGAQKNSYESESVPEHAGSNGISATSGNEKSKAGGSQSTNNGVLPRTTQTARSDKSMVEIEADRGDRLINEEQDASDGATSNGCPSLILELQKGAQGIARHLLNLQDPSEANAQLRILEMKCPQLFKGNMPM